MEKKCSTCNDNFECKSSPDCWCMDISKIPTEKITDEDCLCMKCLLKKISEVKS